MALLFSGAQPFVQFCRGYQKEQFCEITLTLDQWLRRRCRLKIFLIWNSGGPFVQLCNFGRGYYEQHFCEIIWTSGSGDAF